MKILCLHQSSAVSGFEVFLQQVSEKLAAAIAKKMQTYTQLNEIYTCNSLKILNPRVWGYKDL